MPSGTNKIRYKGRSGHGNNLYLDSICVVNNPSPVASVIRVIPQGLYDYANDRMNLNDTVTVYLRNSAPPYDAVDYGRAILDSLTFSCLLTFTGISNGTYYVVVKHRNSIEIWSKSGGEQFTVGIPFVYDFTTS